MTTVIANTTPSTLPSIPYQKPLKNFDQYDIDRWIEENPMLPPRDPEVVELIGHLLKAQQCMEMLLAEILEE